MSARTVNKRLWFAEDANFHEESQELINCYYEAIDEGDDLSAEYLADELAEYGFEMKPGSYTPPTCPLCGSWIYCGH